MALGQRIPKGRGSQGKTSAFVGSLSIFEETGRGFLTRSASAIGLTSYIAAFFATQHGPIASTFLASATRRLHGSKLITKTSTRRAKPARCGGTFLAKTTPKSRRPWGLIDGRREAEAGC